MPGSASRLLGKKVAFLFQEALSSFHPFYTVEKQFHSLLKIHGHQSKKERVKLIENWMDYVNVPKEKIKEKPKSLSGGTLQRINIAMGLSLNPDLIIADECTTALDVTTQAQILDLFQNLINKINTALFLISHNLTIIEKFCDSVIQY